MASSANFGASRGRRVAFHLAGTGDGGGAADEDIFEVLESFKTMDRDSIQRTSIHDP